MLTIGKERFQKNLFIGTIRNFRFNSIFLRMVAITFGVFLVLCLINFFGIRVMTQRALENEKSNSEYYVDFSYSYMTKLIQKIDEYMHVLEYDRNVVFLRTYAGGTEYARNYAEVKDVFNKISILTGLVEEIERVYIYFPNLDRIMTSLGEYELPTFFLCNYEGDFDEWKRLLTQRYDFSFNIWNLDTSPGNLSKLNVIKSLHEGRSTKSVIVANLSRDLVKIIFKDNEFASSRRIYITDENFRIFSSNTDEPIGATLAVDGPAVASADRGSYYTDETLVSYRHLHEDGIYFIVVTPKAMILRNVENLTFGAYLFLAIMLAAGLVLSFVVSQQFYLPIGQMLKDMERFANVSRGIPGTRNEYDYINSNIHAMLANNEKLETIMRDSAPFIIDILIMKLVGGGQDVESAALLARQYNIQFRSGEYRAILMKCTHSYINMSQKAVADLTVFVKKNLSDDVFSVLKLKEDEILVVTFYEAGGGTDRAVEHLQRLSALLEETYEDEVFYFGLGGVVGDLFGLDKSYQSAQKALCSRPVQAAGRVFAYGEGQDGVKGRKTHIPVDFEERYKNALLAGNMDMSEDMIYDILDSNYSRNITYLSYTRLCAWLLGIMERVVDTSYDDMAKKVSKDLLEDTGTAGDIFELNERLLRNNRLLCAAFTSDRKGDSNLRKILKYIDQNFNKSINLDGVAYNFGYNSSYLSRLFKHVMGISFSDYLGKKRIEYAKKLLESQTGTIKEVAEASGYNSTGIFIKAFEKAEGVTPGEYRRRK